MKHVGIEIKFYNLDTFIKQIDVNFIDLDSKLVDLNYKVASLIFCHFWRSIADCSTLIVMFLKGHGIHLTACVNRLLFPCQPCIRTIRAFNTGDCFSFQDTFLSGPLAFLRRCRGTQREYSSKPLKHRIVKRILLFKR